MIPVYINNWNVLKWVQNMTAYLEKVSDIAIIIVDNKSTYQPLLDWYYRCGYEVIRLPVNGGTHVGYDSVPKGNEHRKRYNSDYFIFTDADLDLSNCPTDLVEVLKSGIEEFRCPKAGLSIEINDVPEDTLCKNAAEWDKGYWEKRLNKQFFEAPTDTTFAIYPCDAVKYEYRGVRSDRPYTVKHMPWYFTKHSNFTDEEIFLFTQRPIGRHGGGQWSQRLYKHISSKKML